MRKEVQNFTKKAINQLEEEKHKKNIMEFIKEWEQNMSKLIQTKIASLRD